VQSLIQLRVRAGVLVSSKLVVLGKRIRFPRPDSYLIEEITLKQRLIRVSFVLSANNFISARHLILFNDAEATAGMTERCPTCGDTFDSTRGLGVHHSAAHDELLPNRTCAACEETFHSEHERKYCSEDCRETAVSFEGENNPNWGGGRTSTTCERCGAEFLYYPSEKPGLYCSECVENEQWRHDRDITGQQPTLERRDGRTRMR
jgi:hypothetical protein